MLRSQGSQLLREQGESIPRLPPPAGSARFGSSCSGTARRLPDCQTSSAADSGLMKVNGLLPLVRGGGGWEAQPLPFLCNSNPSSRLSVLEERHLLPAPSLLPRSSHRSRGRARLAGCARGLHDKAAHSQFNFSQHFSVSYIINTEQHT